MFDQAMARIAGRFRGRALPLPLPQTRAVRTPLTHTPRPPDEGDVLIMRWLLNIGERTRPGAPSYAEDPAPDQARALALVDDFAHLFTVLKEWRQEYWRSRCTHGDLRHDGFQEGCGFGYLGVLTCADSFSMNLGGASGGRMPRTGAQGHGPTTQSEHHR
jgi:hypothetical protein